jgi:tripartite-type tricarboxylate transporter receptor subunit TctC
MKLPHRRQVLHLAAGAAALPAVSRSAWAQAYPTRPVRWIVPYPPGGAADPIARLVGPFLSERLGKPVVIENKPGAGANIGTEFVVRSPPDGHTLLFITTANMINVTFYRDLSFDFMRERDITPVAGLVRLLLVLEVNPSVPVKTVAELIAYAKANPGKVNFASAGVDTSLHLAAELFNMMTGTKMIHVPYRGNGPAFNDLIGGQVQVMFPSPVGLLEYIRAGKLRALAVTMATRSEALADLPTVGDFVPGYEASGWFGVGAPRNTPSEIIDKLNKEINAALADPKLKTRLADLGGDVLALSPGEFGKLIADETEKWGKVIRAANIKPE